MKYSWELHRALLIIVVLAILLGDYAISYARHNDTTPSSSAGNNLSVMNIEGIDLDGHPFDGNTLIGKYVLLDFWAVWCGPCLTAIPELSRLNEDFADRDFRVIGVASHSGTIADVKEVVGRFDPSYTIILGEPELAKKFGVIGFPTYFLVNSEGLIAKKYVGELKDLYNQIATDLQVLLDSTESGN